MNTTVILGFLNALATAGPEVISALGSAKSKGIPATAVLNAVVAPPAPVTPPEGETAPVAPVNPFAEFEQEMEFASTLFQPLAPFAQELLSLLQASKTAA